MQRAARNAKISRDDVEGQMILRQESAISSREAAQVRLRSRCKVASIFPFRNYLCSFNSERCENAISNNSTRWCWGAFCVEISCKLLNEHRQTVDIGDETFLNWKSNERTRAHARAFLRGKEEIPPRGISAISARFLRRSEVRMALLITRFYWRGVFSRATAILRRFLEACERGSLRLAKRKSSFRAHAGTEALIYSRSLTFLIRWILLYDPGELENPLDSRFRYHSGLIQRHRSPYNLAVAVTTGHVSFARNLDVLRCQSSRPLRSRLPVSRRAVLRIFNFTRPSSCPTALP